MEYFKTSVYHIIKLDDDELESLVNALESCDLTERRTFNCLLRKIKENK